MPLPKVDVEAEPPLKVMVMPLRMEPICFRLRCALKCAPPPGVPAKATPLPEVDVEAEPILEVMVVPLPPGPEEVDDAPPKDCALQSKLPGERGY